MKHLNSNKKKKNAIVTVLIAAAILAASPLLLLQQMQQQQAYGYTMRWIEDAPMAASGENVYVVWWSNRTGQFEVMFRASHDNGRTFEDKINLSNTPEGASLQATIAASGENNVIVTWLDNQTGNVEEYVTTSTDRGQTFSPPTIINGTKADPRQLNFLSERDFQINFFEEAEEKTQIATSGNNVYVVSWDRDPGNWDIFFARSTDGGVTFEDAMNLSDNPETHSDDAIMIADGENVYVTWWERTSQEQPRVPVMRVSNDNGETFGPVLMLAANGTIGATANSTTTTAGEE
ncbi:MAG: glycoside hydrolase [Thermoproteota archaeon]|nr:glycoside hydrolase [Thermoproteota archaeon]